MQNACMPNVTVRDLPEDAHRRLVLMAEARGQSLQQFLRSQLIELSEQWINHQLMREAKARLERTGTTISAEEIVRSIREDRGE